jgi:periplasmic protein TonB
LFSNRFVLENTLRHSSLQEHTLIWALVVSFLVHAFLAFVLPGFHFDPINKKADTLNVELVKLEPPAPVTTPEPPKPEPAPETIKKTVEPKPIPKPVVKKMEAPSPVRQEPPPTQATPVTDTPPRVIAADPKPDATPHETIQQPPPEKVKPEPSHADVENALGEYAGLLGRAIAKHKQYPKIAQMRGWQGDVILDLKIDSSGNVVSAKVRDSSGHDALDNQALEMVKKAAPFPAPPEALRSGSFNITVPVSFKLESA